MGKLTKTENQIFLNDGLGELILIYRRRQKISQEKLGALVGLTRQTIGLIEAGMQDITFYNMIMLIKVLKIPKEEIEKLVHDRIFKGETL